MHKTKNFLFLLFIIIFPMLVSAETLNSNSVTDSSTTPPSMVSSLSLSSQSVLNTLPSTSGWMELGPRPLINPNSATTYTGSPLSGRITAIIVNQSSPNEMYLGGAQGGVWKTTNNGASWIPLTDHLPDLAVGSLAISPDNNTLYVGTGEQNHAVDSHSGIGIYKTTNGGNTWTLLGQNIFENNSVSSISINKTNPNYILASSTYAFCCHLPLNHYYPNSHGMGIFLSRDGGQTWVPTTINGSLSDIYGIAQILADPSNNSILFASDYSGHVYESENSGLNWTSINLEQNSGNINPHRVAIAISASEPNVLFASYTDQKNNLALTYTYNITNSKTNTLLSEPFIYGTNNACNSQCWYNFFIAADPTNASILYIGGVSLFRTLNQGISWQGVAGYGDPVVHPDFHAVDFIPGNPSKIIVGSDGGIYSSINTGITWTNLNSNLGLTQFESIASSPTNDSILIGGTQDNGCEQYTNSTTWNQIHGADAGSSLFLNDTVLICNFQSKGSIGVAKSINGGSFFNSFAGINMSDPHLFYPPMAQDPHNKSIIYYGTDYLYKSFNFADSWFPLGTTPFPSKITAIGLDPTNQNNLYVGTTTGQVFKSTNGGSSWNNILNSTTYTKYYSPVSGIAVDLKNPSQIYVSFSSRINPRLVISENAGSTWTVITNLGQIPINDAITVLKINPATDVLFLGTEQDMYYYNGSNYNLVGSGLPNSTIYDFTFTQSNYLVAATHGRGVWLNYITPMIGITGINANSSINSSSNLNIQITDPNGLTQAFYNWDNATNQTTTGNTAVSVPISLGQHTLKVYAQDPTGNWRVRTLEITLTEVSTHGTPGFEILPVIGVFLCLAIVFKHRKSV